VKKLPQVERASKDVEKILQRHLSMLTTRNEKLAVISHLQAFVSFTRVKKPHL
jgi:hypothetical protein